MPCSFRFSDGICIETEYKGQLCTPILISDREIFFCAFFKIVKKLEITRKPCGWKNWNEKC